MVNGTFIAILVLCAMCGYVIGMINPSYLIARHRGFDIRTEGTGNAGGTNAMVTMGKGVGIGCMVFDICKTIFMMELARRIFPATAYAPEAAAFGCFIGHMFPAALHFRGGKGVACLAGVMLYYSFPAILVMAAIVAVIIAVSGYPSFGSISAAIMVPVWVAAGHGDPIAGLFIAIPCVIIVAKHMSNLKQIASGTEYKVRFLWDKEEEKARVEECKRNGS